MALTAKIERQKLLVGALGLFVFANMLSFVLPGFGLFVLARVLMALGAGMVVVTALDIAAKIAPEGKSVFGFIALIGLLAIFVLYKTIPQVKGDAPVPLTKQLALLKSKKVALGLSITFFWLGGYSVAYTYISPYLLKVAGINEAMLSGVLLVFGVASLIGSKFGGYSTDKWGVSFTLIGGMLLHIAAFLLLSAAVALGSSWVVVVVVLVLWSFAAWSSGPTQQYNLIRIKPNYSGVMLGLNQSTMQLSMAAGAGIGGLAVDRVSLSSITWFGTVGVVIAVTASLLLFSWIRQGTKKEGMSLIR